jgi:phage baseplate assembly protein W
MAANQTVNIYGKSAPRFMEQIPTSQRNAVFGLNFPLGSRRESGGFFARNSGVDLIKDAVKQLLLTDRAERVMLPGYGTNLKRFLFQPLDELTFEAIKREITSSFYKYIVGATITKIKIIPLGDVGPSGGNSLKIALDLELTAGDLEVFEVEVNLS